MDPALREFDVKGLFWVERSAMPGFVGAPPPGRLWVVCEGFRDGGVAPTGAMPCLCGSPALGAMGGGLRGFSRRGRRSYRGDALFLYEPRPRGDCGWFAGVFATGASVLQGGLTDLAWAFKPWQSGWRVSRWHPAAAGVALSAKSANGQPGASVLPRVSGAKFHPNEPPA